MAKCKELWNGTKNPDAEYTLSGKEGYSVDLIISYNQIERSVSINVCAYGNAQNALQNDYQLNRIGYKDVLSDEIKDKINEFKKEWEQHIATTQMLEKANNVRRAFYTDKKDQYGNIIGQLTRKPTDEEQLRIDQADRILTMFADYKSPESYIVL